MNISGHHPNSFSPMTEVVKAVSPLFVRGEGATLYDEHQTAYLNLHELSVVLGEGHAGFSAKMKQAFEKPASAAGDSEYKRKLIAYLSQATSGDFSKVHFTSSGSEAVEWGVRLAQKITGRTETVCFWNSIHGRTYLSAGMSGNPKRKTGYGPLPPGIVFAPYPVCGNCRYGKALPGCGHFCLQAMDEMIRYASANDVAAVLIEPVQGTGIHAAPKGYLKSLREWTRKNGSLLIFDEIQSGMGRTGSMFYYRQEGVVPDMLLLGKALGNGAHISALLLNGLPEKRFLPAVGGGSGDSPYACAAACAVFEELLDNGLLSHVSDIGDQLLNHLGGLKADFPELILDVRGKGLAFAVQFVSADTAANVFSGLDKANILHGKNGDTLILKPPYSLTRQQAAFFAQTLRELLAG